MPGVESAVFRSEPLVPMAKAPSPSASTTWEAITVGEHDGTWYTLLDGVGTGASRRPQSRVLRLRMPAARE